MRYWSREVTFGNGSLSLTSYQIALRFPNCTVANGSTKDPQPLTPFLKAAEA